MVNDRYGDGFYAVGRRVRACVAGEKLLDAKVEVAVGVVADVGEAHQFVGLCHEA